MPSAPLCCRGCFDDDGGRDADPYGMYGDTKNMIDSLSVHAAGDSARQALEAKRASLAVDDDADGAPTSSLQRLQRNNPFQGLSPCPARLFVQGAEARSCGYCGEAFGVRKHKHHCRLCGLVFHGGRCSRKERLAAPSHSAEPVTVCTFCYGFYTLFRQVMQKGRKFLEYGRNRSCVHRSVELTSEGDSLSFGPPVHIPGRSREQHLRDAGQVSDVRLLDVSEVATAYPAGALLGFSESADGPVIKLLTGTRSILLGLESADDQKLWLEGFRAAMHVAKRRHHIADASGESWREENLTALNKRHKERARKMLGYNMSKQRWSQNSPKPDSTRSSPFQESPQPYSSSQQQQQQQQQQRAYRSSMQADGGARQYDQHSGSSGDGEAGAAAAATGLGVPQNSASNSGCPSPSSSGRRRDRHTATAAGNGNGHGMSVPAAGDLAQAIVEMEMRDDSNGQKQRWTVRATSSMPQQKVNEATLAPPQPLPRQRHRHQAQQQQQQESPPSSDYSPSPSLGSPTREHGPGPSSPAAMSSSSSSSSRPPPRKAGPPRPPPPAIVRATPPAPVDETLDETAHVTLLARDMPIGGLARSGEERRSARFKPLPRPGQGTAGTGPRRSVDGDAMPISPLASPPPFLTVPTAAAAAATAGGGGGSAPMATSAQGNVPVEYATEDD